MKKNRICKLIKGGSSEMAVQLYKKSDIHAMGWNKSTLKYDWKSNGYQLETKKKKQFFPYVLCTI